jgi:dolichol-phosphate mannosyltransferase
VPTAPPRWRGRFVLIGLFGVVVHPGVLGVLVGRMGLDFCRAMTVSFILDNRITYRDQRLGGWKFVRGLVTFFVEATAERLWQACATP